MSATYELSIKRHRHVLTIAGSDSSGGAGIQADLKTITAFECYGSSVLTGLTAQNTLGVQAVHEVPPDFVLKQLEAIFEDEPPVAIKIGMLTSATIIEVVSKFLKELSPRPTIILDPVMISTSGHALLPSEAISAMRSAMLPNVDWITPNIPEAQALVGWKEEVKGLKDMIRLADELVKVLGAPTILLKGGHLTITGQELAEEEDSRCEVIWDGIGESEEVQVLKAFRSGLTTTKGTGLVVDILIENGDDKLTLFVGRKVETSSTHGTGCTLSSALACAWATEPSSYLSLGQTIQQRICRRAISYTQGAVAAAYPFGRGHGPLDHSYLTCPRGLPAPTTQNPHPFMTHLISSNAALWKSYVEHPFVTQLAEGTLPQDEFQHYIKQDYHYLRHYARAHSLGAYKSESFEDIKAFSDIAQHIARESEMHVEFCAKFGVSKEDLFATPESAACAAYSRYIIDVGAQGDLLDLYVALASCLVGYGEVGLQIRGRGDDLEGNVYRRWIEDYSGSDFQDAVTRGIENLERRIANDPPTPKRLAKLAGIWNECVRLEIAFWDMGLNKSL